VLSQPPPGPRSSPRKAAPALPRTYLLPSVVQPAPAPPAHSGQGRATSLPGPFFLPGGGVAGLCSNKPSRWPRFSRSSPPPLAGPAPARTFSTWAVPPRGLHRQNGKVQIRAGAISCCRATMPDASPAPALRPACEVQGAVDLPRRVLLDAGPGFEVGGGQENNRAGVAARS